MSSKADIAELADALVTFWAGRSYDVTIAVERTFLPRYLRTTLSSSIMKVAVVPREMADELNARDSTEDDLRIEVAFIKKVTAKTNAVIDPLVYSVQQMVRDLEAQARFTGLEGLRWITTEWMALVDEQALNDSIFMSVVGFTFRGMRTL